MDPQQQPTEQPAPVAAPSETPATAASKEYVAPQRDFLVALLLSIFVGYLGVDRFYLGKVGTGVLKLITFAGFGLWWLIDLVLIVTGNMTDKQGRPLVQK